MLDRRCQLYRWISKNWRPLSTRFFNSALLSTSPLSNLKQRTAPRKMLARHRRSTISRITRINRGPPAPAFNSSLLSSLLKQPAVRKSGTIPVQLASSVVWRGAALPSASIRGYLATNTAFAKVFAIQTCLGLPFVGSDKQLGSIIREIRRCGHS
jgi:hypothetical protein